MCHKFQLKHMYLCNREFGANYHSSHIIGHTPHSVHFTSMRIVLESLNFVFVGCAHLLNVCKVFLVE